MVRSMDRSIALYDISNFKLHLNCSFALLIRSPNTFRCHCTRHNADKVESESDYTAEDAWRRRRLVRNVVSSCADF